MRHLYSLALAALSLCACNEDPTNFRGLGNRLPAVKIGSLETDSYGFRILSPLGMQDRSDMQIEVEANLRLFQNFRYRLSSGPGCSGDLGEGEWRGSRNAELPQLKAGQYHVCVSATDIRGIAADAMNNDLSFEVPEIDFETLIEPSVITAFYGHPFEALVSGDGLVAYRYKISSEQEQCADLVGYGKISSIDIPLSEVAPAQSSDISEQVLCVLATHKYGEEQPFARATMASIKYYQPLAELQIQHQDYYRIPTNISLGVSAKSINFKIAKLSFKVTRQGRSGVAFSRDFKGTQATQFESLGQIIIDRELADDRYHVELEAYDEAGRMLVSIKKSFVVDTKAPNLSLYLGQSSRPDLCQSPPEEGHVESSQSDFSLPVCADDGVSAIVTSGVDSYCIKADPIAEVPQSGDACWQRHLGAINKDQVLMTSLDHGTNDRVVFVRDHAGNLASKAFHVTLDPGIPPTVKWVHPKPTDIAHIDMGSPEHADGLNVTLQLSDDITAAKDIRLIATLLNAEDASDFVHLACNFSNTEVSSLCPSDDLQDSALFSFKAADSLVPGSTDQHQFKFIAPTTWDPEKSYILAFGAFDEAGNAEFFGSPEFNAGYEVVAGRTLNGVYGSATRMQTSATTSNLIIAAKRDGTLIDLNRNLSRSPRDKRTCRFYRNPEQDPSAFDCKEMIVSEAKLLQSRWYRMSDRDVFFVVAADAKNTFRLYKIDWQQNPPLVTALSGGQDQPSLAKYPPANTSLVNFKLAYPTTGLSLVEDRGILVIRDQYLFYSYDLQNGTVQHLAGGPVASIPENQMDQSPQELILPNLGPGDSRAHPEFAVTNEGMILFGGSFIDDSGQRVEHGSGLQLQYVLTGAFSQQQSIYRLRGASTTWRYFSGIEYDKVRRSFWTVLSWSGLFELKLDDIEAGISEYRSGAKDQLTVSYEPHIGSARETTLYEYLSPSAQRNDPHRFSHLSTAMFRVQPGFFYYSDAQNGVILSYELASRRFGLALGDDRLIPGHPSQINATSQTVTQAINRSLRFATSIIVKDQNVFVQDLQGLHFVNDQLDIQLMNIDGAALERGPLYFIDGAEPTLLQLSAWNNGIRRYRAPLDQPSAGLTILSTVALSKGNNQEHLPSGYFNAAGLYGLDSPDRRALHFSWDSRWLSQNNGVYLSYLSESPFYWDASQTSPEVTIHNHPDKRSLDEDPCTKDEACVQGAQEVDGGIAIDQYRLNSRATPLDGRKFPGSIAVSPGARDVYFCQNSALLHYDLNAGVVYTYRIRNGEGLYAVNCINDAKLKFHNGKLFIALRAGIFEVDTSKLKTGDTNATLVKLQEGGKFFGQKFQKSSDQAWPQSHYLSSTAGLIPGDFTFEGKYIYYTDSRANRLFRNELAD